MKKKLFNINPFLQRFGAVGFWCGSGSSSSSDLKSRKTRHIFFPHKKYFNITNCPFLFSSPSRLKLPLHKFYKRNLLFDGLKTLGTFIKFSESKLLKFWLFSLGVYINLFSILSSHNIPDYLENIKDYAYMIICRSQQIKKQV